MGVLGKPETVKVALTQFVRDRWLGKTYDNRLVAFVPGSLARDVTDGPTECVIIDVTRDGRLIVKPWIE